MLLLFLSLASKIRHTKYKVISKVKNEAINDFQSKDFIKFKKKQ